MLYINLMQCRKIFFDIMQNREIDLKIRCALVLTFINEVQEKIDSNDIQSIKLVKDKYLNKDFIKSTINDIEVYKGKTTEKYINIKEVIEVFRDLKHIKPNDILGLEDALRYFWQNEDDKDIYLDIHKKFDEYYKEKSYEFEQILVYFVFRYFMKAVFDYDALAKVKIALISYIMIKELCVVRYLENKEFTNTDMVDIAHTYSKDVEHLEENIETLEELFETNDVFSIEELLITILN